MVPRQTKTSGSLLTDARKVAIQIPARIPARFDAVRSSGSRPVGLCVEVSSKLEEGELRRRSLLRSVTAIKEICEGERDVSAVNTKEDMLSSRPSKTERQAHDPSIQGKGANKAIQRPRNPPTLLRKENRARVQWGEG